MLRKTFPQDWLLVVWYGNNSLKSFLVWKTHCWFTNVSAFTFQQSAPLHSTKIFMPPSMGTAAVSSCTSSNTSMPS